MRDQRRPLVTKRDGIQAKVTLTDDHRVIIKLLEEDSNEFHMFKLLEEKMLRVVLRGIPLTFSTDEIEQNLPEAGFEANSVSRMHKSFNGTSTDMTLAQVQLANMAKNRNNFNLTKL